MLTVVYVGGYRTLWYVLISLYTIMAAPLYLSVHSVTVQSGLRSTSAFSVQVCHRLICLLFTVLDFRTDTKTESYGIRYDTVRYGMVW